MVAFLLDSGKETPNRGGITVENVTEELLNGFFCHYEPPTSEQAQFKAARAARADPIKYSNRPVAKPILKMSHLTPKNKKQDKGIPQNTSSVQATDGKAGGASTASRSGSNSGKSVTWRDEKANQGRTKVEKDVVGFAANYCGFFRQGEGLTDILMSPKEKAVAEKTGAPLSADKETPPTLTAPTPTTPAETPISTTPSKDDSVGSSQKKRLTPILTGRNNAETPAAASAATSVASSAYHPNAGQRILYDDLGNPIEERDAYASLEDDYPATPGGASTIADETTLRSTVDESGAETTTIDTPTAEKTGADTMDKHNPFAYFCAVPAALIGGATIAATSAAAAVGYKSTIDETKEAGDDASTLATPQPSPSILRRPAPTDRSTGIMAEYRDERGVYEPMDYDNPFPHIPRDQNRTLQYRRVRSPPARRRQPTPRRMRRYEDDAAYEEEQAYYNQRVMQDGAVVSSLGKLPRQSTSTYDTNVARMSPRELYEKLPTSRRSYDMSPSTMTGGSAYYYEDEEAMMRRSRHVKSPGRRSDVYSDVTMEEDYYRHHGLSNRSQATEDYEENQFLYLQEELHPATQRTPVGGSRASSRSGRRSRGAVDPVRTRMMLGEEEDEQLSPREYAERYRKMRNPDEQPPRVNDSSLIVDKETEESEEAESEENLSPRQYAQKYRRRRSNEDGKVDEKVNALIDEEDDSENFSDKQGSKSSGGSGSKRSNNSASKQRRTSTDRKTKKEPTPRGSIDPAEAVGQYAKRREQLPPTPRKQSDSPKEQPRQSPSQVIRSHQKELNERVKESRESLLSTFSPRSMATDDEIREEVSSVGMASDTIRPLYENPFRKVPTPVIEERESVPVKQVQKKGSSDVEGSTLSAVSGSTLSSRPSTQVSSQKKKKKKSRSALAVQESSSMSTRSKKLWRGWKKTVGNVKNIVKEIEDQRIHPPHLSHKS
ncbi:MAG: hypothetical protein SGILL_007773 [Bacillariaceae sp.]